MTAARSERLRVLLADPDPLVRRVIRDQLRTAGFVVVADTGDGREAVELVRFYRPELAVIETRLLSIDGPSAIRAMTHDAPQTRVVVLSADDDAELGLQVLQAGAVGYLTKEQGAPALPRVLAKVAQGEAAVPRTLAMRLLESLRTLPDRGWRPLHSQLTTREWEVVELLAEGAGTHDIADELVLSPATVYGHVKNIMRKLDVKSRDEAVAAAEKLRPAEMGVSA
jgi:two-component system, NarL family, response regulator LiaR